MLIVCICNGIILSVFPSTTRRATLALYGRGGVFFFLFLKGYTYVCTVRGGVSSIRKKMLWFLFYCIHRKERGGGRAVKKIGSGLVEELSVCTP